MTLRRECANSRDCGSVRAGATPSSASAEFGTGALAEDRKAAVEKALHERAVVVSHKILQDRGTGGRTRALEGIEVLQEERDAGKGAVGQAALDLALGVVVMLDDDGVDLRIDLRGTGDRPRRAIPWP